MYPKKDTRLYNETNRRHSNAVIGILIISLTIIFGLSVLGVWGVENTKNGIHDDNDESPFIPENKPTEEKISEQTSSEISSEDASSEIETFGVGSSEILILEDDLSEVVVSMGSSDVSVPECKKYEDLDTEVGSIEIIEEVIITEPLPLCITQEDLDDCYVLVEVTGGYEPICGIICVCQTKTGCGGLICINWELMNPDAPCCEPKIWKATFTLCDGPICLESNHVPEVEGWCVIPGSEDGTLDKWVDICIMTRWTGCELPEQEFLVILAHKAMSQNPRLSMRDTSSS